MGGYPVWCRLDARAVIVIPCIRVAALTRRCIAECRRLCPAAEIHVLSDVEPGETLPQQNLRISITGPLSIAAKRNIAARSSEADFLAFIDSDAYPIGDWLTLAIQYLLSQPELGAVGGPTLSPPDEQTSKRFVGAALRSPLVSGTSTYRKTIRPARLVGDLPSCNLVVRRKLYLALGGMNEALFTGEDLDFCARLIAHGYPILYRPDVQVYHENRRLGQFVLQRLTYGASVPGLLRQRVRLKFLLLLLPALFLSFLLTWPIGFVWPAWFWLQGAIAVLYGSVVLVEAMRHSEDLRDLPGTAVALILGNLVPGIGTLAQVFGLVADWRKVYTNHS
jgi:hypothetical protein